MPDVRSTRTFRSTSFSRRPRCSWRWADFRPVESANECRSPHPDGVTRNEYAGDCHGRRQGRHPRLRREADAAVAGTLIAARRPVIAGLGITEMGRVYGRSAEDFAAAAVRLAVADAGLDLSDVDGLLTNAGLA